MKSILSRFRRSSPESHGIANESHGIANESHATADEPHAMADPFSFYIRVFYKSDARNVLGLTNHALRHSTLAGDRRGGLPTVASIEGVADLMVEPAFDALNIWLLAVPSTDRVAKESKESGNDRHQRGHVSWHGVEHSLREDDEKAGKDPNFPPILGFLAMNPYDGTRLSFDKTSEMTFLPSSHDSIDDRMQHAVHKALISEAIEQAKIRDSPYKHFIADYSFSKDNRESIRLQEGWRAGEFKIVGTLSSIIEIRGNKYDKVMVQRSI